MQNFDKITLHIKKIKQPAENVQYIAINRQKEKKQKK